MSIFALGINHKTAPIALREQVYFASEKLPLYLQDILVRGFTEEAVLLSTCNRSELYCETDDVNALYEWFCSQTTVPRELLTNALYLYHDQEAIAHIMEVACGLDSMILGEPQILGQMKEAFSESCAASAVDTRFHRLFQQVFKVAKEIRTTTAIGACPVSVASAAARFAQEHAQNVAQAEVLLIGAGETVELLVRYLRPYLQKSITLINRSVENAYQLAASYDARVLEFSALDNALEAADIVFSATSSPQPIVNASKVAMAMSKRSTRPMMLIDIAVPRDIDPQVNTLKNVNLYCIDDLKAIIEKNRQGRQHAAEKAREMIQKCSEDCLRDISSHANITHTIRAYRDQIEAICQLELLKAKQLLQQGSDPDDVLDVFARAFTKKLLHAPSVQLREAGAQGRFELLRFAQELFAIPDPEVERI